MEAAAHRVCKKKKNVFRSIQQSTSVFHRDAFFCSLPCDGLDFREMSYVSFIKTLVERRTMPARGQYSEGGELKKKKPHESHGHTHEPIHPATSYSRSTTAVRSTAVVQHRTQQKKKTTINEPTTCDRYIVTGVQQNKHGAMPEIGEGIADKTKTNSLNK